MDSQTSDRLTSLSSLRTTIQSVDTLTEAVENPVKLMVMVSTFLDEYCSMKQNSKKNQELSLPESCLELIQESIPLFKSDASTLFSACLSSVIGCFCEEELEDEVRRTVLMFVQFYGLQGEAEEESAY